MKKLLWLNIGGLAITLLLVWLQVQTGSTAREAMSRAMRLSQVSSQAEAIKTDMMQMSDAMRGFLLDTSRQDEWNRKRQADEQLKATVDATKKMTDDARLVGLIDRIGDLDDQKLDPAENKVLELAKTDREAAVKLYFAEYLPIRQEQMALVEDLRSSAARMSDSFATREMADMTARASFAVWVCGSFVVLMGLGVAFSARTTSHLQQRIAQAAETMGIGALGVLSGSRQVSHGAQTLAQNSAEQAASLEETSASMTEFRAMVERNSQHASGATQLMHEVEARVADAMTALDSMVASMGEITESSGQISRIMRTVDEIAFQTNILALNAAVEAARAGEAGLGFAVVADEVRNLAQRSAEASRDTSGLIERSVTKTQQGAEKLNAVAAAIQAIEGRVTQTKGLFEQVNASSLEQAQRVEHVTDAVRQLESTTQQAAAIAQENAAASEEMSSQAESTQEIVATLQSLVGASSARRARAQAGADARATAAVRTPVLVSPAGGRRFAVSR